MASSIGTVARFPVSRENAQHLATITVDRQCASASTIDATLATTSSDSIGPVTASTIAAAETAARALPAALDTSDDTCLRAPPATVVSPRSIERVLRERPDLAAFYASLFQALPPELSLSALQSPRHVDPADPDSDFDRLPLTFDERTRKNKRDVFVASACAAS